LTKDDLSIYYTPTEESNISADDGVRVDMVGTSKIYLLHQFKFRNPNSLDNMQLKVNLQAERSPHLYPVYLQVWNTVSNLWETLDFDDTSLSGTDFDLLGTIVNNPSNYYDTTFGQNEVTFRVYQFNGFLPSASPSPSA